MANRLLTMLREESFPSDEDEFDTLRALLVSLLMKDARIDREEIYSCIFGEGKKIIWH